MPSKHLTQRVRAAPDQVFDMVADVENYPVFINLISNLRITKKISETDFEAEAIVVYKMFRETFRSHIHIDRDAGFIRVTKAKKGGALKTLENKWNFHELSDGSTAVNFYVDVSLKAFPLNMLVKQKMGRASEVIIDAFVRRAAQVCDVVGDDVDSSELLAEISSKKMV
ncbi:MAG: type II toxin-antitoxin system RatA family toxin [Maricaulaceae bacterium]